MWRIKTFFKTCVFLFFCFNCTKFSVSDILSIFTFFCFRRIPSNHSPLVLILSLPLKTPLYHQVFYNSLFRVLLKKCYNRPIAMTFDTLKKIPSISRGACDSFHMTALVLVSWPATVKWGLKKCSAVWCVCFLFIFLPVLNSPVGCSIISEGLKLLFPFYGRKEMDSTGSRILFLPVLMLKITFFSSLVNLLSLVEEVWRNL